MHLCPHCQTGDEHWATRCPGCGALAFRPIAGGAQDDEDEAELPRSVSITFTLR